MLRIKLRAAGWEARMLNLCYAAPPPPGHFLIGEDNSTKLFIFQSKDYVSRILIFRSESPI